MLGAAGLSMMVGPVAGQHVYKAINALQPGEYTWHPERQLDGPVSIVVSLDEQRVHVYRNGVRIWDESGIFLPSRTITTRGNMET